MPRKYVLSDESVNSYGFRVLTAGINIESRFQKNPVILYNHDGQLMSVGKMSVTKEGEKLIGVPEWDMEDPIAVELARKYEKGYMNGFSIGFDVLGFSDNPELLLPGQTLATVTESEMFEVSATNLPSNANAVRLSTEQKNKIPQIVLNKKHKMDKIIIALGLSTGATQDDVIKAYVKLKSDNDELKKQCDLQVATISELQKVADQERTEHLENLLSDKRKAFSVQEKETYRELAKVDYLNAVKLIGLKKDIVDLHKIPNNDGIIDEETRTFKQLQKEDFKKLSWYRKNEPETYIRLYKAQYGTEPKM